MQGPAAGKGGSQHAVHLMFYSPLSSAVGVCVACSVAVRQTSNQVRQARKQADSRRRRAGKQSPCQQCPRAPNSLPLSVLCWHGRPLLPPACKPYSSPAGLLPAPPPLPLGVCVATSVAVRQTRNQTCKHACLGQRRSTLVPQPGVARQGQPFEAGGGQQARQLDGALNPEPVSLQVKRPAAAAWARAKQGGFGGAGGACPAKGEAACLRSQAAGRLSGRPRVAVHSPQAHLCLPSRRVATAVSPASPRPLSERSTGCRSGPMGLGEWGG